MVICVKGLEDTTTASKQKDIGEIFVCPSITMDYLSVLRSIKRLIVEGRVGDIEMPEDFVAQINPHFIWISRVNQATGILENGLTITLDLEELVIYESTM